MHHHDNPLVSARPEGPANPLVETLIQLSREGALPPHLRFYALLMILASLAFAGAVVYATGGTRFAYVHFAYVPVIVASFFFGLPGGVLAAVAAGLVVGPFMPLNVEEGTAQSAGNWLTRMSFFLLIGALSGIASDLLRRQLRALRRQAYYDRVTGLPNRAFYLEKLEALLTSRQPADPPVVALAVGLGHFEDTISNFGYQYADKLHKAAGERLRALVPPEMELFSISGGLFALIHHRAQEAAAIGLRLARALDERFEVDSIPTLSSGHTGIAQHRLAGSDALTLTRASISSFRRAEEANEPIIVHDGQFDRLRQSTLRLLPDLQEAIRTGSGIALHYQPIIDLDTGRCRGAEALVRWQHPGLGPISPGEFIPAAEKTALMRPLTRLILARALTQLKQWQEDGLDLYLTCNVSIRDVEDPDFTVLAGNLLEDYGVDPSRFIMEVTESALMTDPVTAVCNLAQLRKLGISIALDDFGTGQSSLSYLSNLPVDIVKLDGAFAREISSNARVDVVVRSAIEAAHQMGQRVVAEGIEARAVLDRFRELSCDYGQGYFMSRPMPEDRFRSWIFDHEVALLRGGDAFGPRPRERRKRVRRH